MTVISPQTQPPVKITGSGISYKKRRVHLGRGYGYFVSLLKLVLPTIALVLVVAVIMWPLIGENEKRFIVNVTQAERESTKNLTVFNATYSGQLNDTSQFTITSEHTEQTDPDDPIVTLTNPKGDVLGQGGDWYAITAKEGRLNRETGTLELWGEVNAFQDSGMELLTDNVVLDFETNSGYGLDPIKGQGPIGIVEAEGFRIFNNGARIELLGRSKVVIYGNEEPS